ncbi:hypothetical protein ACT4XX_10370 [Acinetobacter baumannii]
MSEFKVTDLIVAKGENDPEGLLPKVVQVHEIFESEIRCEDDQGLSCLILKSHLHMWRFAESQEIAAGHRIDDDFPIESHISPHCKAKDV